jgi:hypothetical protein
VFHAVVYLVDHVEDFGEDKAAFLGIYGRFVERTGLLENAGLLQIFEWI